MGVAAKFFTISADGDPSHDWNTMIATLLGRGEKGFESQMLARHLLRDWEVAWISCHGEAILLSNHQRVILIE